jgi:hypothetical protein
MAGTKEDVIGILSATEERKLLENWETVAFPERMLSVDLLLTCMLAEESTVDGITIISVSVGLHAITGELL